MNKATMARIHREGFDLKNQIVESDSAGGSGSAKFFWNRKGNRQSTVERGKRGPQLEWLT